MIKLGIPEAEKTSLAGVGAQYDSEVVYHSMKEELIKQGVVYTDMETAVREYPDLVKKHFMKCTSNRPQICCITWCCLVWWFFCVCSKRS